MWHEFRESIAPYAPLFAGISIAVLVFIACGTYRFYLLTEEHKQVLCCMIPNK